MNAEQQSVVNAIWEYFEGIEYSPTITYAIDTLLEIIDQQQAIVDAAQTYRDAIDRWMADVGETELPRFMPEYAALVDALGTHGQPGHSGLAE